MARTEVKLGVSQRALSEEAHKAAPLLSIHPFYLYIPLVCQVVDVGQRFSVPAQNE